MKINSHEKRDFTNARNRRKKEVKRLREEGYAARKAGKHVQTCPEKYMGSMDRYQWEQGWHDADREIAAAERDAKYEDRG